MRQPLIVVGMHRSGTSLLSDLLTEMGVPMGPHRTIQGESRLFRVFNQEILRRAKATWVEPSQVREFVADPTAAEERAQWIRKQLEKPKVQNSLDLKAESWGWKDPRNALTLPVWLQVFPEARLLHVVRNGIDVSHSLVVRERSRHRGRRFPASWPRPQRTLRQIRTYLRHGLRPVVPGPSTYPAAFALWQEYVAAATEDLENVPSGQVHSLRFEDLLKDPARHLREIASFAGASAGNNVLEELAGSIDGTRTLRFLGDPSLERFYEEHRDDPLMIRYGYGDLSRE